MTGRTLGPYLILDKLGEGGMGAVFKARDTRLGREVALKFLPADVVDNDERRSRFMREAQSASRLNHPNIITIYDIAEANGTHFITMEYVAGKTLADAIPASGLETSLAIRIAIQIAGALAKAHAAGIVHRDLKPANIMLTDDGVAKVLDFGLAKMLDKPAFSNSAETRTVFSDQATTELGIVVGTAAYMSPEQASGLVIDHRSDIFSFGLVFYEMLSGERAFPGHTPIVAMAGILHAEPRPLKNVPAACAEVVMKCLRKNPDERFQSMAAVRQALEQSGSAPVVVPVAEKRPSIAVLPFLNMNRDEENEFFCDGLTEELINALSQLKNLRVVSRSTVFQFKGTVEDIRQIGEKLQVATALEGSVRKAGNRLRITAQLVNLSDGCQIWSQRFDREMKDIFDVQDEVTLAILEHLKVRLTGADQPAVAKRPHENPEAYTLYLKGRYHQHRLTAEGYQKALACFEEAIALDPRNARAYAGIAEIYTYLAIVGIAPPNDFMPRAKAAAMQALEIDEALAEANSALGLVHLWHDWDWLSAQRRLRRAVELSPGNPDVHTNLAMLLSRLGRAEEAMLESQLAVSIDPLALQAQFGLADTQYLGRFPLVSLIDQCRNVIDLIPQALWPHWYLIDGYGMHGDYDKIPAAIATARPIAAGEPISEGIFGWAYALAGHTDEARRILEDLRQRRTEHYCPATPISWIYLGLGEYQQALDWLEVAFSERDPLLTMAFVNPSHDALRTDPRFESLLRRMNFGGELPTM